MAFLSKHIRNANVLFADPVSPTVSAGIRVLPVPLHCGIV
jgi:hypothetical protein